MELSLIKKFRCIYPATKQQQQKDGKNKNMEKKSRKKNL